MWTTVLKVKISNGGRVTKYLTYYPKFFAKGKTNSYYTRIAWEPIKDGNLNRNRIAGITRLNGMFVSIPVMHFSFKQAKENKYRLSVFLILLKDVGKPIITGGSAD